MSGWTPISPWKLRTAQKVAVSGASASSAPVGAQHMAVLLSATTDCHVRIGNGTQTAASTDTLIKANYPPLVFGIAGGDLVAVIQDTAPGSLYITELSH